MPHYDHSCDECKEEFTVEMRITEVGKKEVVCPKCGSKKVQRLVTNKSFWSESVNRYVWKND